MHSRYSLVTRASSREKVDFSESLRCFVSYPFSLRAGFFSSDARVFGNTSQLFCYRIRREAQLALKTRSKSQREMLHYDHLTPSCNNCKFFVWFEICLYVLNFILSSCVSCYFEADPLRQQHHWNQDKYDTYTWALWIDCVYWYCKCAWFSFQCIDFIILNYYIYICILYIYSVCVYNPNLLYYYIKWLQWLAQN